MALAIGSMLGGYEVVALIGHGGMGEVYRATDAALGRDVALKVLPQQENVSPRQKERFVREARAASALNHPNIITIYEIGTDRGIDFIAMEYVRGRTLGQLLVDSRTSVPALLSYALQIAQGLSRAHDAGIVHRDLKPANIMVTDDRLIKILDFGIAKIGVDTDASDMATQAPLTNAGASVGTIGYMSPEQALSAPVDARSDVFSFGVILFEMLTKTRPFEGATPSEILHNLHFAEPALPRLPAEVPRPVVAVIRRCLSKQPQDRYRSMAEVADVLSALSSSDGTQTHRDVAVAGPALLRAGSSTLRIGGLALLAAVVIVLLMRFGSRLGSNEAPTAVPAETLSSSAHELTTQAAAHLVRQDRPESVARAIQLLEKAIQVDATYAPAYANLSEAYLRSYKASPDAQWLRQARDAADRALALNPDLAIGHLALGFVDLESGRADDSRRHLLRASELDPLNPFAHLGLAAGFSASRRDEEAEAALKRAIELGPTQWRTHTELGQFYYVRARYAQAIDAWDKARTLTPDNLIVLRNLGAAYYRARRYDEAASVLQRALEVRPSGGTLANLGNIYFAQGRYSDAVGSFEKALELDANNYLYWGNLGDAYRWAPGRRPEAAAAYRRASELLREPVAAKPADAELRTRHALYLIKAGDRAAALRELAAVQDGKLTAQMLYRATVVHELAGDRTRALESLKRAIDAGYPASELSAEPELTALRADPRYHRLVSVKPTNPGES